ITLTVTPKAYNDKTKVSVTIDDDTIDLKKENGVFKGVYKADLFAEYEKAPIVIVNDGNANHVETMTDNEFGMLWNECLPCAIVTNNELVYNYTDNKLKLSDGVQLDAYTGNGSIKQANLIIKVNDKIYKDKDITPELKADLDAGLYIDIDEKIRLNKNDNVSIYLIIKDSYGYTMTERLLNFTDNEYIDNIEQEGIGTDDDVWTIVDKNGKVVNTNT
ncbi:MAG: hypothetical protein IJU04_02665, partial [Ruminococcus sp.]|nr:hypothetical protein [Ruminococcus sp.]